MSVKSIRVNGNDLNSLRISQITKLIKAISANRHIHPQRVPSFSGDNKIIFCVTDNSRITNSNQFDHNSEINERFKTINSNFTASYYEIWDKIKGTRNEYQLNRIYFHLYQTEKDNEYILLHTDPIDNDLTHGNYKRSPHLHIKYPTDDIIPHAHFALNINDYDLALSSLDEVNRCFKNHIDMLSHQILNIR